MFGRKKLKAKILQLQSERDELQGELHALQEKIVHSFVSLDGKSIKRAIVGKQGCGKTHYIQNVILPQLTKVKKEYFIIDSTNEYKTVPEKNKLAEIYPRNGVYSLITDRLRLLPNPKPLVIFENCMCFNIRHFRPLILEETNDLILVFSSIREMISLGHLFDHIYLFDTNDEEDLFIDFSATHPVIDMLGYNEQKVMTFKMNSNDRRELTV